MFWGIGILIVNNILINDYYDDLIYRVFCGVRDLFIATYVIFTVLIFTNNFPERIKKIEKFKYLAVMLLLSLIEIIMIASALPDLD